jgi:hypothetical protein
MAKLVLITLNRFLYFEAFCSKIIRNSYKQFGSLVFSVGMNLAYVSNLKFPHSTRKTQQFFVVSIKQSCLLLQVSKLGIIEKLVLSKFMGG